MYKSVTPMFEDVDRCEVLLLTGFQSPTAYRFRDKINLKIKFSILLNSVIV